MLHYHPAYGFPDEFRKEALQLAEMKGVAFAAKKLKISKMSVYKWRKRRDAVIEQKRTHISGIRPTRFSQDFKIGALQLSEEIGAVRASLRLQIGESTLYKWKKKYALGKKTTPSSKVSGK